MTTSVIDLTKEPPRSPGLRLGGYDILARTLDKGRAMLAGKIGDYHFDCPLDNMLFSFKGVKGAEVKMLLEEGQSDDQIVEWLKSHGEKKSAVDIAIWNTSVEGYMPYDDPAKTGWFGGVCQEAGIDPTKSSLFDFLDEDDRLSHAK